MPAAVIVPKPVFHGFLATAGSLLRVGIFMKIYSGIPTSVTDNNSDMSTASVVLKPGFRGFSATSIFK
jgi:hypothetical protein